MTDNPSASPENARDTPERQSRLGVTLIELLVVLGFLAFLVWLLLSGRTPGPVWRRSHCEGNLKHIGRALRSYESTYHALPPAYTVDANGKPLHSWRTLILPFLDQQQLYDTIDLAKPWNDPANSEAYNTVIRTYQCPEDRNATTETPYLAVVTADGCFRPDEPRQLSEITDNHFKTIMVLEVPAGQSVHWVSPLDADEKVAMSFGPDSELPHDGLQHGLFVSGVVHLLREKSADERRALSSIAGDDPALPNAPDTSFKVP